MPAGKTTKEAILKEAVKLFADDGFEGASMKTIAKAVGVKAASLYNHYKSKDAILGVIYEYYRAHAFDLRPKIDDCVPVLRTGTPRDIVGLFNYSFSEDPDVAEWMFDATRIIWARMYTDEEARAIYRHYVVEEGIQYILAVLQRGAQLGRVQMQPQEMETFAQLTLAGRMFAAGAIVSDPDRPKWRNIETSMMDMVARLLVLSPPLA